MLNRLYIVVGVLAILVLAGGFVVPQLIDWGNYRERIEQIVEANLGTDVTIDGEIDFSLLPQPVMRIGRTVVGPLETPLLEIGGVTAEFSLTDFLRDRFTITQLQVENPAIYLTLDADGEFALPLDLPENFSTSNVSVDSADISGGVIRLADARSGSNWQMTGFSGQLRISGVSGPFSLQGSGEFEDVPYDIRVNTSALGQNNQLQTAMFVRPAQGDFSLSAEGLLSVGDDPSFSGQAVYRRSPEGAASAGEVRGDMLLTGDVQLAADRLLLSAFTLLPDENQASTRMTGAAVIDLGAAPEFDAVLSGGVVALAPRDAREEQAGEPYELVRLLGELPPPPLPPIPGRIGVDISELNLRAFALRNVRLDAHIGEAGEWELDTFTGGLPGATELALAGTVREEDGGIAYDGAVRVDSGRLDVFSQMWRPAGDDNPLFNMSGALSADLSFSGGQIGLADGQLTLDGEDHSFAGLLTVDGERNALLSARLGDLSARQSRAILAILPDFSGDPEFGATFPNGSVDVAAERATVFDLEGENFAATFDWGPGGVHIDQLGASNWGGAMLALSGDIGGTLTNPVVSGSGRVTMEFADDRFALQMLDRIGAGEEVADWVLRSLPVDTQVELTPANEQGEQVLSLAGRFGVANMQASANLAGGFARALSAPLVVEAALSSDEPELFADQFGLGVSPLPTEERVTVELQAGGTPSNSLQATLTVASEEQRLAYAGTVIISDLLNLRGNGQLDFSLDDPGPLLALLSAEALSLPPVDGTASLSFAGNETINISALSLTSDEGPSITGTLSLASSTGNRVVTGQLQAGELDVATLWSALAGPASLVEGDGLWPEGPIDVISGNRQTRGRIDLISPAVKLDGRTLIDEASMVVSWDDTGTRLQNLKGISGGGTIEASVELCCSAMEADKQLTGRLNLEGVLVDALLPEGPAGMLGGTLDGVARFNATGASLAELAASLSGEGSFTVNHVSVAEFDPDTFAALSRLENITDLSAEDLTGIVGLSLENGSFNAPAMSGVFRIAAGEARADNLAAESDDARLFGNLSLDVAELELGGAFSMSPTNINDPEGLLNENNTQVTANLGGTLTAPERELDIGQMVDAIQVRAFELEVERLEQLREEDEARQRAAAAERARLMEIEAERQAEEAARVAAEEEARQQRELEQRRFEEQQRQIGEELSRQQQVPLGAQFQQDGSFVIESPVF